MPMNLGNVHWVLTILDLVTWEITVYDSLSPGKLDPRVAQILDRFQRWLPRFLDSIDYWERSSRDRSTFTGLTLSCADVPIQCGHLGDCGVWVMIHMLNKISGRHQRTSRDAAGTATNFRLRVAAGFFSYHLLTDFDP